MRYYTLMPIVFRFLFLLGLGLWLGGAAMMFLSAPSAFSVLPSSELAGRLVDSLLTKFHGLTYAAAVLMLIGEAGSACLNRWTTAAGTRAALVGLALGLSLYGDRSVRGRMRDIKETLGPLDRTAEAHPLRMEFNRLHRSSVHLAGAGMALMLGILGLYAARPGKT